MCLKKNRILIEEVIKVLDFEVNEIVRGLRINKIMIIGVFIFVFEQFFSIIILSLEIILFEIGYSVVVCDYKDDEKLEKERFDIIFNKKVYKRC